MRKKYFIRLAAVTAIACAAGIAQPAMAQDAKEFVTVPAPPEGKAQVVFFRQGGYAGSAISCAPHEAGVKISSLPPARYFIVIVEPGQHLYTVQTEAKDTIRLDLKPGDTEYVKCHIEMGWLAGHPKLEVAQGAEFTSKQWKAVDDARKGANVLTQAQLKGTVVAKADTSAPASPPTTPVSVSATPAGTAVAAPSTTTAAAVVPAVASGTVAPTSH